ncbi:MAG: hypothetical protein ACP5NY_04210 [Thermocladium sp.]
MEKYTTITIKRETYNLLKNRMAEEGLDTLSFDDYLRVLLHRTSSKRGEGE